MPQHRNKKARSIGAKAESALQRYLQDKGYEVRRTHLSAFPDVLAWNDTQFLMIEMKARTVTDNNRSKITKAVLRLFENSSKELKVVHSGAYLLCCLQIDDELEFYQLTNSGTKLIQFGEFEER